ncbi:MAG: hypothetical protein WAN03_00775 [Candidatus Sulfotelmatobacter sp.]
MSAINGDKARFNRIRKQKIARRLRNQEMLKAAATQTAGTQSKSADGVSGARAPRPVQA